MPDSLQLLRGQFAIFSCVVTGLPAPPVQWIRNNSYDVNGTLITPLRFKHVIQESVQLGVDGPDTVSSRLTIGNLSNIDQGHYTCRGVNAYDTENFINARESASVYLAVFGKFIVLECYGLALMLLSAFVLIFSSTTGETSY